MTSMERTSCILKEPSAITGNNQRLLTFKIIKDFTVTEYFFSLMWDLDHELVYCPIYKVASGTWTTNFLRLSQFNQDLPKWQRFSKLHGASESTSRGLFPPPDVSRAKQKKLLKKSTKFLVVRHPFDRIISAYTGKIANPSPKPRFYKQVQAEILKNYRTAVNPDHPTPTFSEYVHYLLHQTDDLRHPREWRGVDCVQSYYSVCVPCDVEYDVIIKLETHDQDTEYLIRKLNLTELQEPFTMWKHSSKDRNSIGDYDYYLYDEEWRNPRNIDTGHETSENTLAAEMVSDEVRKKQEKLEYKKNLFGQLTREEVEHLYDNYRVDFEMFGYDAEEFLNYASS